MLPSGLVTFLFTDIEGSTRLAQLLGGQYRSMLTQHRDLLRAAFTAVGGRELSVEGDAMFFAFGAAATALVACARAQRDLAAHRWPAGVRPRVRMGLHTGPAEPYRSAADPRGGEYSTPEVHRAARVAAAAHGGQVLCSAGTAAAAADRLPAELALHDLGLHRLRGFDGRERLHQVTAPGLERRFPRPRGVTATADNLPVPSTVFIGRGAEQHDLRALLAHRRLVTVVGPGGAGKTRLAVELAAGLVPEFPDGVWFADFAGVPDADLMPVCLADALGLRPEPGRQLADTLVDHVAGQRLLLVLDTCDTYPATVGTLIDQLLAGGAGVTVLATSREPLGPAGETVWRIPPLALEPSGPDRPSEAVALLADRAEAARGGRPVTGAELPDLDRIATAMDGLPLALELAAARLRVLSTGQLAQRLDDVIGVLDAGTAAGTFGPRPARHRTMDAAVDWSYRTLPAPAARLLRRLAVFTGPVDLSTVESLGGEDPLGALTTLVDKSMLQADDAGYRMLDPIRAYAARRLHAAGEEEAARNRHVTWCLQAAREVHQDAVTLSLHALDRIAGELRAALRWTATGGCARAGLAIAGVLGPWWRERGLAREGRHWLTLLCGRSDVPAGELAAAYHLHAQLAGADGEYAAELLYSQQAEAAAYEAGDPALLARVLAGRAVSLLDVGRVTAAERVSRDTLHWAAGSGVTGDALAAVYCLAEVLWLRGDLDEAAALLATARPVEAGRPADRGRRSVDMLLGLVALARGDLVAAHEHLVVALRARVANGFDLRAGETLRAMAVRCAFGGEPRTAARLFGAAQAARARLRTPAGVFGPYLALQEDGVRAALGDPAFDEEYAEGGMWTVQRAAAVALAVEHPDLAVGSTRFSVA